IERNLALVTDVAAFYQRWPVLARCSEPYRALQTCFEGNLNDPQPYWLAFLAVFGAEAVASRMLFDGHPTLDKHLGLVLCSFVDDAGVVPPWEEYLTPPAIGFSR